jgi:hypothetical protein
VLLSKEIENVSLLKHLIESRLDVKRIAFDPSFGHQLCELIAAQKWKAIGGPVS